MCCESLDRASTDSRVVQCGSTQIKDKKVKGPPRSTMLKVYEPINDNHDA